MEKNNISRLKTYSPFRMWFKRTAKKVAVGALTLGIGLGAVFGFVGCSNITVKPTPPEPDRPVPDTPIASPTEMTFAEFLSEHHDKAVEFAGSLAKSDIDGRELVSREIRMQADSSDRLAHVSYAYGYKVNDTDRTFKVVEYDFADPIDLNSIVDGSVYNQDIAMFTAERELLTVNAQENYQRQDVLNAIVGCIRNIYGRRVSSSAVKLFAQEKNTGDYTDTIRLLEMDNNGATLYKFDVVSGENDEILIKNLQNSSKVNNFTEEEVNFDGTSILSENYVLEEFKDDGKVDPPVDDEKKVESMEQLLSEYKSEVLEGLSAGYDNLVQKVIPKTILGFDASKLDDCRWNFDCDASGNISKVNLISTYHRSTQDDTVLISSITFQNPLNIDDLTDKNIVSTLNDNIKNGTGKIEVNFTFNKSIQAENQPLAEAIFEVEGKRVENSNIYFYEDLPTTDYDLGAVNQFRAFQITENGVEEIRLIVENASSLNGYIKNLQDGKYKVTQNTSYQFGNFTIELDDSNITDLDFDM